MSARNEIRTRTSLRTPPPQDGASTNFATRAIPILKNHCAQGETRTLKPVTATASETATFTNFATWAFSGLQI